MDIFNHVAQWANDPIIWMRLTSAAFLVVAGWLLFLDKILCRGSNPRFHKALGTLMFLFAFSAGDLAFARAQDVINGTVSVAVSEIFLSTLLVMLGSILIACWLGADYFRYETYQMWELSHSPCDMCPTKAMTPK